jgi:beta-lactamase superfamily II metal-dependent hydrolase
MGYEIDFLKVGDTKSGDAITLRFGNLTGPRNQQTVVVVDGGYVSDGERVVAHLARYYDTDHIDILVSTHPDADHVGGLETVLANCTVGQLWMHLPWTHTADIARMFQGGRVTDMSVRQTLRESLNAACSLEAAAMKRGIRIFQPFTGLQDATGSLVVLGPTQEYYRRLLPGFRCTPVPKGDFAKLLERAMRAAANLAERWHLETLTDSGDTTAENNSSVILLLCFDGRTALLTADAGKPALTQVVDLMEANNIDPKSLGFVQVPHHGSRRNVGPTLLNRLLGPKLASDTPIKSAFVSVAANADDKHPSKRVVNAFRRRGVEVLRHEGGWMCHRFNAPDRSDAASLSPLPFYDGVIEEDGDD